MNLSKSRYTRGVQCPKMLWMEAHRPECFDASVLNQAVLDTGNLVGDLAMGRFGSFIEIPFIEHGFSEMARLTREHLDAGVPVICEATFEFEGNLCMVDILLVEGDGVSIVEVKSSTSVHDIYLHDAAFQTWVLTQCGLNVKSVSVMHLNRSYEREGELDLGALFTRVDVTDVVMDMQDEVELRIAKLKDVADAEDEPACEIGPHCGHPYECGYRSWCWRNLPSPNVFDLGGVGIKRGFVSYYNKGIVTFEDALAKEAKLNARQQLQVVCALRYDMEEYDAIVDKQAVGEFLSTLSYPLYFLDFETIQPAIPPFDGVHPFDQIPTQYSLHCIEYEGGPLTHREFLAKEGTDPRRDLAEALARDIPPKACVLAYNMSFERSQVMALAVRFPDLADRLRPIHACMRDLMVPFRDGAYYVPAMNGSYSIKAVLPALFPHDPELDYHALEGIHNGSEAMNAFLGLEMRSAEEIERTRNQLLAYCKLDTLAMVRIWEKLVCAVA
ncbi:MAG: DUF2779 domain-containing protein [Eggerthellaceae bacterium]|nr:DUF2779 domain-containing protein [Eggerthellaceae bacterium]